MLEGVDAEWISAGTRRTAYYMNLEPGDYIFKVKAAVDGDKSGIAEITTYTFYKGEHFYRTYWFYTLSFVLLSMLTYIYYIIAKRGKGEKGEKGRATLLEAAIDKQKYDKNRIDESDVGRYAKELADYMEEHKPFREPAFTLSDLADMLSISTHDLSQVINSHFNQNFHAFINSYRVEEVKKMLLDPEKREANLLSVAFDAGFKSKTTFNTIFKKLTGETPSQFRKNRLGE